MKNAIRRIREAKGLSRATVAERAETSQQQIARLESGERRLTVMWAHRLALALDVTIPEIIDESAVSEGSMRTAPLFGALSERPWEKTDFAADRVPCIAGGPDTFALHVEGDIIDKVLPDGSIAGFDPSETEFEDQGIFMLRVGTNDGVIVRRFDQASMSLLSVSTNARYKDIKIGSTPFLMDARLVWGTRTF